MNKKLVLLNSEKNKLNLKKFKAYNMKEWKEGYHNLNTILTQNNLIDESWYKINKILLTKQNNKILNNKNINDVIIYDFMTLYGHQENRKFDINKTLNIVFEILCIEKEKIHIL